MSFTHPTKLVMARVVIQALYNRPDLPPADDARVVKLMRHNSYASLANSYRLAVRVIGEKVAS